MATRSPRFGLTRTQRGWVKRVGGKLRWVASIHDAPTGAAADEVYVKRFATLAARPKPRRGQVLLGDAANEFLDLKSTAAAAGKLHEQTLDDYKDTLQRFCDATGGRTLIDQVGPTQFSAFAQAIAHYSVHRRMKHVTIVRMFFRWCLGRHFVTAVDYGTEFRPPSKAEQRKARASKRRQVATANDVRRLLRHGSDRWRAMLLLGLNCGFGPNDLATLPLSAVTRENWIDHPRPKTGVERRCPLWPETVEAVKSIRPRGGLLFRHSGGKAMTAAQISRLFTVLRERACYPHGFYSLRRTFRTIADEVGDQRAAALVMGHETGDIGSIYVQSIAPERLQRLVEHVRSVLKIKSGCAARRVSREASLSKRLRRRQSRVRRPST